MNSYFTLSEQKTTIMSSSVNNTLLANLSTQFITYEEEVETLKEWVQFMEGQLERSREESGSARLEVQKSKEKKEDMRLEVQKSKDKEDELERERLRLEVVLIEVLNKTKGVVGATQIRETKSPTPDATRVEAPKETSDDEPEIETAKTRRATRALRTNRAFRDLHTGHLGSDLAGAV